MSEISLNTELERLKRKGKKIFNAYMRTHQALYGLLTEVYLFRLKASKEAGYLDSLYEEADLATSSTTPTNQPYFTPLLRLVCGLKADRYNVAARNTCSQWNKALQAVHGHYSANEALFQHNPRGKLVAFIEKEGGVVGLIVPDIKRGEQRSKTDAPADKQGVSIDDLAIEKLKEQSAGIGFAEIHQAVRIDEHGQTLLLARRESDGKLTIQASNNNPVQIKAATVSVLGSSTLGLPYSARTIVETLKTQMLPGSTNPGSAHDAQPAKGKRSGRRRDEAMEKRLCLRGPQKDVILSFGPGRVSPVTICRPRKPLVAANDNVYLPAADRALVEEMIESREIFIANAEPAEVLARAPKGEAAAYTLTLSSPAFESKRLSFCPVKAESPSTQSYFDREAFKPDWSATVGVEWLAIMRQKWAEKWSAGLGQPNQIKRKSATL